MQIFSYNKEWGPSLPLLKKSRIVFDSKTVTKEFMYRQELSKKPQMKPNDFKDQNIVHLIWGIEYGGNSKLHQTMETNNKQNISFNFIVYLQLKLLI